MGFDCTLGGIFTDCGALLTWVQLTVFEAAIAFMVWQLWRWVKNVVSTQLGLRFDDDERYVGLRGEIRRRWREWRAKRKGVPAPAPETHRKPSINRSIVKPLEVQANGGRDE